jgi:hypothetical protein
LGVLSEYARTHIILCENESLYDIEYNKWFDLHFAEVNFFKNIQTVKTPPDYLGSFLPVVIEKSVKLLKK